MRRLTTLAMALVLVGGAAGCGRSAENPCAHPNSVVCEEYQRGKEEKKLHGEIEEFKHRGEEEHHE